MGMLETYLRKNAADGLPPWAEVAAVIAGENGVHGPEGARLVMATLQNRVGNKYFGNPKTTRDAALAPRQYSAVGGRNYNNALAYYQGKYKPFNNAEKNALEYAKALAQGFHSSGLPKDVLFFNSSKSYKPGVGESLFKDVGGNKFFRWSPPAQQASR